MFEKMSRRRRLVLITAIIALIFISGMMLFFWLASNPDRPYQPGEEIEGLTSQLSRMVPQNYPKVRFVDVSKEAGINFQHFSGQRSTQLPEDMGSGAAWGDYDNDGWLDLFVVNQVGPLTLTAKEVNNATSHCSLYHNNGNGTFSEVSAQAGVDYRGWGMACAWGDYNNDGWLDLFISSYGENIFYHNNGNGTFSDRTKDAGLLVTGGFWSGISWADFNRDGFLDLYVCGYVKYSYQKNQTTSLQYNAVVPASLNPSSFDPERNLLYRNNGDGSFSEIAGKARVDNHKGRGLSAAWCDFDADGWPDLYVANDVSDNVLYHNLGNETFDDISHSSWVADYRGAMGIAVGDWDQDLDMDMFITHWIAQENALYDNMRSQYASLNISNPNTTIKFMDEADRYGLGQIALDNIGWGTSFFDYDNDGRLDLFVANGSTFQQKDKSWLLIPMPDQLFWNRGAQAGFYDVSAVSGDIFNKKYVGRGVAIGDYDNDGDMDIFVVNNGGPCLLLRNDGGNKKRWLKVLLQGAQSNRFAIGAKLVLRTGNMVQIRQTGAQGSYCSQNSIIEHFGLETNIRVDTLQIFWPSGYQQVLYNISSNQLVRVVEGENNP
jgi:hypothetical protein